MDPVTRKFLEDLRVLVELAVSDLERAQGGPLTLPTQRAIRYWAARAFELGRDYALARFRTPPGEP